METMIGKDPLYQEIQLEYERLMKLITPLSSSTRTRKEIDGTGGKVSIADLISYQIGWGTCLIRWYEAGIKGEMPDMPGEGFTTWDYEAIARHFYQKYKNDADRQNQAFHKVVLQILAIVEMEHGTGNLERLGVWPWCTLASGKEWPLSKWIRVNTCAPYKRAGSLIQ